MLTFGFVFINQILNLIEVVIHYPLSIYLPILTMFNPFRGSYGYSFVYFCVGGLIHTYEPKILGISRLKRNMISIVGILISCVFLFSVGIFNTLFIDGKMWDVVWNGYDTIFTFFNVIFIYILSLNYTKNYTLVKSISKNTLGIYFTHGLVIRLTRPWIKTQDVLCNLPVNIIYALLILFVCLMICQLIHKIPIVKKII